MVSVTGSSKSIFDSASEQIFEKLHAKFVEFATKKKRENALKVIETLSKTPPASPSRQPIAAITLPDLVDTEPDFNRFKYFHNLFGIGAKKDTSEEQLVRKAGAFNHVDKYVKNSNQVESILGEFIATSKPNTDEPKSQKEIDYINLQERMKEKRRVMLDQLQRDPDAKDVLRRIDDEKR